MSNNLRTRLIKLEGAEPVTIEVPYLNDDDRAWRLSALLVASDAYAVRVAPRIREILGHAIERRGDVG